MKQKTGTAQKSSSETPAVERCFCTEMCKNIPAKFRESTSKCSAVHPKKALWRNISASHSQNLSRMFLHATLLTGLLSLSDESNSLAHCRGVLKVSTAFLSGL